MGVEGRRRGVEIFFANRSEIGEEIQGKGATRRGISIRGGLSEAERGDDFATHMDAPTRGHGQYLTTSRGSRGGLAGVAVRGWGPAKLQLPLVARNLHPSAVGSAGGSTSEKRIPFRS